MEILIKNGYVIDPLNNIKGEVMDIAVKGSKIVDPSEIDPKTAKVIDAKGMTVMAGGIDVHSHIAGPKVATGRLIVPEDHYMTNIPSKLPYKRAQTGWLFLMSLSLAMHMLKWDSRLWLSRPHHR